MAVKESLEFDLRGALRQLDQLERQITDLRRPVTLDVDMTGDAAREIQTIDTRLNEIVDQTQQVNRELNLMEGAADRSEADFTRLARAMGISEEAARDIAREVQQAEGAATRLDAEARSVARAMGLSEAEAAKFTAELHRADRAAAGIDTRSTNLAGTFGNLKTLAIGIGGALAAIGVSGLLRGANAAIQSFANLEDSANAVNVIFGRAAESVRSFGEDAAQSAGLSETAFNQAVVPIGALLQNFGFDAREAAEASVILVQRGADLASVYGGTVQDALLAVGAALRGEADPLERYGASISAARVEQFALANQLARTKAEITPAITLQARYGLILADTAKVQGDYVNTAGDLANAQRTAGAEAQNFSADLGEALAPALEVIIGLVPVLLDGLRQLVPGFAAAADSAAAFLESTAAGEGEGTGVIREFFATLRAGAGDLAELPGTVKNLFSIISGGLTQNAEAVDAAVAQMDLRFARSKLRRFGTELASDLDRGIPSVKAFTDAVTDMGQQTENLTAFEQAYRDFAIAANLSVPELRDATKELLDNSVALGLSVPEVQFLTLQYALLNDELREQPYRQRAFGDALGDIPFETVTTRFTTFISELEEIPAQMDSVTVRTRAASDALGQSLNPFDEPPEQIALSAKQFFDRVTAEINANAKFQAGVVELILAGNFNLAAMIAKQGPAAQATLTGFLKNLDLAAATEAALTTGKTDTSEAIGDFLEEAIAAAPPGPARQALIDFMTDGVIDSPEVENAIVAGTSRAANTTTSNYLDQLEEEIGNIDPTVLQDKLSDLFSGVTFDISADQFNFPNSGEFQGTIGVGAVFTGGGGGTVNVTNNIYNPTTTDLPTNVAQANQSTSAVANLLNRVGPN